MNDWFFYWHSLNLNKKWTCWLLNDENNLHCFMVTVIILSFDCRIHMNMSAEEDDNPGLICNDGLIFIGT